MILCIAAFELDRSDRTPFHFFVGRGGGQSKDPWPEDALTCFFFLHENQVFVARIDSSHSPEY
jgi:hypothetical protein